MLKWADETRRKLDSVENESSSADSEIIKQIISQEKSPTLLKSPNASPKAMSPVQKRRQRKLQALQERRRHSSCGQLYAAPEQITLAWNNSKQAPSRRSNNSLPNTPTHSSKQELSPTENNNIAQTKPANRNSSPPMLTKPELLQIAEKQSDKNRNSFWKNLMGKTSWPSRTYKSPPIRKSQSVVETYRKIEESYYTESHPCGEMKHDSEHDSSDYGLADLVISCETPSNRATKESNGSIRSYHSLKTIRRQSDSRRPKLLVRRSGHRSRSPDSGFSDIRLSMSMTDDIDGERDSGVPRSPTLSSSSSSSDDSACYRK